MSTHSPAANFKEWVDLLGPLINAGATVVIAVATVMYFWLTRKLWIATAKNAELTEKTLEASNEPLCAISNLTHTFRDTGTLTISFQIQNAGRVPVDNVNLVTEWKGTDSNQPDRTSFEEEWIGVLLPGQSANFLHSVVVRRVGEKVVERQGDRVHFEIACVHIALSARFENRAWKSTPLLHVVLAEFRLSERTFRVRQSKIVGSEEDRYQVYHLLDDVSATGHGTGPASMFPE
jgi:hypothetical protein